MTTTTRRTAKITTARTSGTTKPYAPAALFRVFDKKTGAVLGYVAPSRNGKDFYHVTCDENANWHCDCPATVEHCCHIKAAMQLCEIRVKAGRPGCKPVKREEVAAQIEAKAVLVEEIKAAPAPLHAVTAERGPVTTRLTNMLTAPLNGNRSFSILRR